jgi:hypothetical protein
MNVAYLCKAKPRVLCREVHVFRRTVFLPLLGNGVRQATATSTEQHSVQNTTWYSWLQGKLLILSNAQWRLSTKLHGATTLVIIT